MADDRAVDARLGRAFDTAVTVGGLAVGLFALLSWATHPVSTDGVHIAAAFLIVVMTQFPLVMAQRWGEAVIGFEAPALILLALTTSVGESLTFWFVAQALSQGFADKTPRNRLFNIGITGLSGGALVGILALGPHLTGRDSVGELGLTLAASAVFFVVDLVLTALSLSLEATGRPATGFRWKALPLPLLCFVGTDTLGYLGALLYRLEPRWTLGLLLVPIGTILVAVRGVNAARIAHDRLDRLFQAASSAPDWGGVEETQARLVEQVAVVLSNSEAAVRDRPAAGEEISAPLQVRGGAQRYVVAWRVRGHRPFDSDDRRALETLVGVAEAAITRRTLVDEMTHLARHDPLTGLANRTVFTDRLDHALELRRDRLVPGTAPVAILYCDLDGFKAVNDRSGHEVGDRLLTAVAERILSCLRPGDTAARLGGDEFAVLLEQAVVGGAEGVAERILRHLSAPFEIAGRSLAVTASIGIAYVTDEARAVDVMRHADTAMYRAKAGGKNRSEIFQPAMQDDSMHKLRLEDALRKAVRDREFTVAFQPIVDLASGLLSGYEALARWTHPELGTVPPDVFIPLAERLGLVGDIGLHMLEQALTGGQLLQARLGRQIELAVNISPLQIVEPELLRRVRTYAARHPEIQLVLELTEMSRLGDDEATLALLDELVTAGVRLAVDDFGTGYSSIAYLHRLPVSIVKIDRTFVQDLASARSTSLIQGVVAMAKAMGLRVVGEGVEDADTADSLRALGSDCGQGYYWSQPLALSAALDALAEVASPANSWAYETTPDNVRPIFG